MAYCPGCDELRALRRRNRELLAENARLAGQNTTMHRQLFNAGEEAKQRKKARPCYAERCRWRIRDDGAVIGDVRELPLPELAEGEVPR